MIQNSERLPKQTTSVVKSLVKILRKNHFNWQTLPACFEAADELERLLIEMEERERTAFKAGFKAGANHETAVGAWFSDEESAYNQFQNAASTLQDTQSGDEDTQSEDVCVGPNATGANPTVQSCHHQSGSDDEKSGDATHFSDAERIDILAGRLKAERVLKNKYKADLKRTREALDSYMDAYQNMRQYAIDSGLDVTCYYGPDPANPDKWDDTAQSAQEKEGE